MVLVDPCDRNDIYWSGGHGVTFMEWLSYRGCQMSNYSWGILFGTLGTSGVHYVLKKRFMFFKIKESLKLELYCQYQVQQSTVHVCSSVLITIRSLPRTGISKTCFEGLLQCLHCSIQTDMPIRKLPCHLLNCRRR